MGPVGADAATLELPVMPEFPVTPTAESRRRNSTVSVSTVDSADSKRDIELDLLRGESASEVKVDASAEEPVPDSDPAAVSPGTTLPQSQAPADISDSVTSGVDSLKQTSE